MVSILESKFQQHQPENEQQRKSLNETLIKLALLPQNCRLKFFRKQEDWPILQVQNIFILPGVPQLFQKKISSIASFLVTSSSQTNNTDDFINNNESPTSQQEQHTHVKIDSVISFKVLLGIQEFLFVHTLNQIVKRHPNVKFGSYPNLDSSKDYKTVVT